MKQKRLDRDAWGFQWFPYYQMRLEREDFRGLVSLIRLIDGDYCYWDMPKAGEVPVCGEGMIWLQLIPDNLHRVITAKFVPREKKGGLDVLGEASYEKPLSVCYVDVIEDWCYAEDGVAIFTDKYLDVIFSPEGDIKVDDRDELDIAYQTGELSESQYQEALRESEKIIEEYCTDMKVTESFFQEILVDFEKRIADGEIMFRKNTERERKGK